MPKTNPPKKHFTYTVKDFYKEYSKNTENPIPYKLYKSLINSFFRELFRKIIYERYTFMMPYSLGTITIKAVKCDPKNLAIDFDKTKKLGKVVRHLNTHTFGHYFKVAWEKDYVRFKNNVYYLFTPTSSDAATKLGIGKRALSKHIKELANDPNKPSFIKI